MKHTHIYIIYIYMLQTWDLFDNRRDQPKSPKSVTPRFARIVRFSRNGIMRRREDSQLFFAKRAQRCSVGANEAFALFVPVLRSDSLLTASPNRGLRDGIESRHLLSVYPKGS